MILDRVNLTTHRENDWANITWAWNDGQVSEYGTYIIDKSGTYVDGLE